MDTTLRTTTVEGAIRLLKYAISINDRQRIENAIFEIGNNFNWTDLEVVKMEWDNLLKEVKILNHL